MSKRKREQRGPNANVTRSSLARKAESLSLAVDNLCESLDGPEVALLEPELLSRAGLAIGRATAALNAISGELDAALTAVVKQKEVTRRGGRAAFQVKRTADADFPSALDEEF